MKTVFEIPIAEFYGLSSDEIMDTDSNELGEEIPYGEVSGDNAEMHSEGVDTF